MTVQVIVRQSLLAQNLQVSDEEVHCHDLRTINREYKSFLLLSLQCVGVIITVWMAWLSLRSMQVFYEVWEVFLHPINISFLSAPITFTYFYHQGWGFVWVPLSPCAHKARMLEQEQPLLLPHPSLYFWSRSCLYENVCHERFAWRHTK